MREGKLADKADRGLGGREGRFYDLVSINNYFDVEILEKKLRPRILMASMRTTCQSN